MRRASRATCRAAGAVDGSIIATVIAPRRRKMVSLSTVSAGSFVVGVMSVFWMAVVAAVIFAEKVLPRGPQLSRAFAFALVVLGVWVAIAPASVPELTQPGTSMMERSE